VWALVISDIRTGPFLADVVRGVEDVAYGAGYSLFLCNADEDAVKEASYLELAAAENVAGVILTPSGPQTDLTSLENCGIPVVLADRTVPFKQVDAVMVDNVGGAYQAVSHLLAGGYKRVACITGPLATTTGSQRYLGYCRALEETGVALDESLVRVADFREGGGRQAMQDLIEQEEAPDAVFVANHVMTVGALHAINQAKLAIPTTIAVVGFDDASWAPLLRPPLTTVAQPTYDIGLESARLLLSRLEGYTGTARTVTLSPELKVRASSAPLNSTSRPEAHKAGAGRQMGPSRAPRKEH
jgi:LacI family transcriptional regulator